MFDAFKKAIEDARDEAAAKQAAAREVIEAQAIAEQAAREADDAVNLRELERVFEPVDGNPRWEYCSVLEFQDPELKSDFVDLMYVDSAGTIRVRTLEGADEHPRSSLALLNKLGRAGWEALDASASFTLAARPIEQRTGMTAALSVQQHIVLKRRVPRNSAEQLKPQDLGVPNIR